MKGYIGLQDWYGNVSRYSYDLVTADISIAELQLAALADGMAAISNAQVVSCYIVYDVAFTPDVPAVSASNLSDKASLNMFITSTKTAVLSIPAPVEGLFLANSTVVDVNDAALQAFLLAFTGSCLISDGESVDTGLGTGGLKDGHWISTARRGRKA